MSSTGDGDPGVFKGKVNRAIPATTDHPMEDNHVQHLQCCNLEH